MLPFLEELFDSKDELTRKKSRSAVAAIKYRNIDLFVQPAYDKWVVTLDRDDIPTDEDIDFYIKKNLPSLVRPIQEIFGTIYPRKLS